MFGREVNIPSDILYPFPGPEEPTDVHDYVRDLRDRQTRGMLAYREEKLKDCCRAAKTRL